jgi:hypothetical protein
MLTMTRLASYQAIHRRNFSKESGSCAVWLFVETDTFRTGRPGEQAKSLLPNRSLFA